jgi:hypothetical protein
VFAALAFAAPAAAGPIVMWGRDLPSGLPPAGEFVSLASGGALQMLALRDDYTVFENSNAAFIPDPPANLEFTAIGMGRTHALGICRGGQGGRCPEGSIVTWGPGSATPPSGQFVAVSAGARHSVARPISRQADARAHADSLPERGASRAASKPPQG